MTVANLRTWLMRVGVVLALTLAGAAGVEVYARGRHLDLYRARTTAVQGRQSEASQFQLATGDGAIPYLPRVYSLSDEALQTAWGTCRFDHQGRTVLVLGDSTTRQASGHAPDSSPEGEAARTWAGRVGGMMPEDVQLCVVAEDGYHPADYRALLDDLGPRLAPDLVVVLLCDNDLMDIADRVAVQQDGWVAVYEWPVSTPVFPPLWNPWLWQRSEAFRFVHWRLAESTGRRVDIETRRRLSSPDSLKALHDDSPQLMLAYLPRLSDEPFEHFDPDPTLDRLEAEMGLTRVQLSPPWPPLRRQQDDPVHLSDQGHARVAEQLGPVMLQALGSVGPR